MQPFFTSPLLYSTADQRRGEPGSYQGSLGAFLFCAQSALGTKQVEPRGKAGKRLLKSRNLKHGFLKQGFGFATSSHPPPRLTMRLKLTLVQKRGSKFSQFRGASTSPVPPFFFFLFFLGGGEVTKGNRIPCAELSLQSPGPRSRILEEQLPAGGWPRTRWDVPGGAAEELARLGRAGAAF